MNRNQNYNLEYKPLFQGEFKNPEQNTVPVNNGYITSENPVVVNQVFETNNTNLEEPPELGPIKNISEAISHQPASLDVLDPMNIIPENYDGNPIFVTTNNDALENYDSRVNIEQDNNINQINTNNEYQNISNIPNISDIPIKNLDIPGMPSFDFSNFEQTLDSSNLSTLPEIPSFDNEIPTGDIPTFNTIEDTKEAPSFPDVTIDKENVSEETKEEIEQQENSNTEDYETSNQDSSELSNETLKTQESIEEKNDDEMLEMFEESVSDESSESEQQEENNQSNEESTEVENNNNDGKKLLRDHVDEIRAYVELLKQNGIEASIAEFDFEHMYQLVIKINK